MIEINKNRKELAELFTGVGAEIGVERAVYSQDIIVHAQKLFCIDVWGLVPGYREHVPQSRLDEFYEQVKEKMKRFNCEIIRKLSMEAAKDFADESLDFVYLDGNHSYENVRDDIREWSKKVKRGGIVAGHDYIDKSGYGVIKAVHELNEEVTIWKADKTPSWSYTKK